MRADPRWRALAVALAASAAAAAAGEEPAARVVLRWQAVPGAAAYDLQVAADPTFARRLVEVRVDLPGHRLGPPSPDRRYWRVRTVDADGRPGPWSSSRVIEGAAASTPQAVEAEPELLDVPPVAPVVLPADPPADAERAVGPAAPALAPLTLQDAPPPRARSVEGIRIRDVLREARPGLLAGWRSNLLGVTAPALALEGCWPLPWLGGGWWGALRAGWWRARAELPLDGAPTALEATADVLPVGALVLRAFPLAWARLYAGAGVGADLVVVHVDGRGALEASPAAVAVLGAGRAIGPGEAFAELGGGVGGVDGPLAKLRTGGISLSMGYRLRP